MRPRPRLEPARIPRPERGELSELCLLIRRGRSAAQMTSRLSCNFPRAASAARATHIESRALFVRFQSSEVLALWAEISMVEHRSELAKGNQPARTTIGEIMLRNLGVNGLGLQE